MGASNIFLLSKSGRKMTQSSLNVLCRSHFLSRTGILPDNVLFVGEKVTRPGMPPMGIADMIPVVHGSIRGAMRAPAGYGKDAVGAAYQIDILIDDKIACHLGFLGGNLGRELLLINPTWGHRHYRRPPHPIVPADDWGEVVSKLEEWVISSTPPPVPKPRPRPRQRNLVAGADAAAPPAPTPSSSSSCSTLVTRVALG